MCYNLMRSNFFEGDTMKSKMTSKGRAMTAAVCALSCALIILGAFIKIPLPMISITLQLEFVLLSAMLLGAWRSGLSVAAYIILGLCGVPFLAAMVGTVIIYVIGTVYFYFVTRLYLNTYPGFMKMMSACVFTTFPKDAVFCLLLAFIAKRIYPAIRKYITC